MAASPSDSRKQADAGAGSKLFHRILFGIESLVWLGFSLGSIMVLVDRLDATESVADLSFSRRAAAAHIAWHLVLFVFAALSVWRSKGLMSGLLSGHPRWVVALLCALLRVIVFGLISGAFWVQNLGDFFL